MKMNELNKFFEYENEAYAYRDDIWFEYHVMGTIYARTKDEQRGYSVEFDEE